MRLMKNSQHIPLKILIILSIHVLTSSQYVASAKVKASLVSCKKHKPVSARVA